MRSRNTWTVEEVDFSMDVNDLRGKMTPAERHLINRLVAFFATGDSIVANNLVLNLYKHINSPEHGCTFRASFTKRRCTYSFISLFLTPYIPDHAERAAAFAPLRIFLRSEKKAEFCLKWIDSIESLDRLESKDDRRKFLLNLICFASCIEGLFFFAAFAYVYFLRSKGLLHGLASGTNWVFRDESAHMNFAFEVVKKVQKEEPDLFDEQMTREIVMMLDEAVECEVQFADDILSLGVAGCRSRTCVSISNSSPTSGWQCSVCLRFTRQKIPSHSWTYKTCRNSPTSSNAASLRIRLPWRAR
jgi:ribonucleoside-diphosphate reductase beta chain